MIEQLRTYYEKSPIIRGLLQLFTPVAATDAALTTHLQNIRERRLRIFFDELDKGINDLSPVLIEQEDFLHAFFATTNAVLRSRKNEKIEFLARLLAGFGARGSETDYPIDEYEEYLTVLEEMSWREITILATLAETEKQYLPDKYSDPEERIKYIWTAFTKRVQSEQNLSEKELYSILLRLLRTGFYQPDVGGWGGGGFEGATGKLTDNFYKFLERIRQRHVT